MPHRFTATKEAFELTSLQQLKVKNRPFLIKRQDDFKGVTFYPVWERLSEDTFRLTCYHKGTFSMLAEEFQTLLKENPHTIVATITLKELFSVEYKTLPEKSMKDIVTTEELKYKFIDLFESEEVILYYLKELVEVFGWKIQTKEDYSETWNDYID